MRNVYWGVGSREWGVEIGEENLFPIPYSPFPIPRFSLYPTMTLEPSNFVSLKPSKCSL